MSRPIITQLYASNLLRADFDHSMTDDRDAGWFPSEGWAIFESTDGPEAQRIDSLERATHMTDDDALAKAKAKGYRFGDQDRPYLVTGWPEKEAGDE